MQQVEYEFPDPGKEENLQEVEVQAPVEEPEKPEVEAAVGRETIEKPSEKAAREAASAEIEIEIEDDTPPADRGKTALPPQDLQEEELSEYSKKVQERMKTLSRTYHDERRAKETIIREREALEQYARQLAQENEQLKTKTDQSHNALIESAKKQVESELAFATQQYKKAYDSGETDAIVEAQQALNTAQIRADKVSGLKPKTIEQSKEALQPQENNVQSQAPIPESEVVRDEKAEAWRQDNTWFGTNHEMTAWALGMHKALEDSGIDARSDEYYEKINSRARRLFPEAFDEGTNAEPGAAPQQKPSNVVAPATRSTSPNKVKLTKSQLAVAKRLNVPPNRYAEHALKLAREQNG
jgi:hypothetical protein